MSQSDQFLWIRYQCLLMWCQSIGRCCLRGYILLQWCHNGRNGVPNHRRLDCLLNRLFRCSSKENIKVPRHSPLWAGIYSPHKGPVTGKMFPFDDVIMFIEVYLGILMIMLSFIFYPIKTFCKISRGTGMSSLGRNLRHWQHRKWWKNKWPVTKISSKWHLRFSVGHYNDVIMGAIASQITSLPIVYSTLYSDADQRKHQSSAWLAFVWRIHRGIPLTSGQKCVNVSIWWRHQGVRSFLLTVSPYSGKVNLEYWSTRHCARLVNSASLSGSHHSEKLPVSSNKRPVDPSRRRYHITLTP